MPPSLSRGDLTRDDLVNAALAAQGLGGHPFEGGGGGGGSGGSPSAGFPDFTFDFSNEASYNQTTGTFAAKSGSRFIEVLNPGGSDARKGVAYATICPIHAGLAVPAIRIATNYSGLGVARDTNPLEAEITSATVNANGGGYYIVAAGLVSMWDAATGTDGQFYFLKNDSQKAGEPYITLRFQNYASGNVQGEIYGFETGGRTYSTADIPNGTIASEADTLPPAYRMRVAIKHIFGTPTEFKVRTDTIDVTENTSAALNGGTQLKGTAHTWTSIIRVRSGDHFTYRVKNLCIVPFAPGGDNASAYAQAIADADSSLWFL